MTGSHYIGPAQEIFTGRLGKQPGIVWHLIGSTLFATILFGNSNQ